METLIKNVPHAQPFALKGQVEYEGGKVVSLTLAQQPGAGITLFAFDAGEAISTHAAPGDAMATILEGTAQITIDGVPHTLNAGEAIIMPAGIPHAAWVADKLHLPMIYVRPKPKDHGKGRQIEGRFSKDDKIVLIDDLITTGGSVLNAVKATEKDGGNVIGVSSIFTYYLPDAKENFAKSGVKYAPLLSYPELLKKENESGHISSEQYDVLKTWHEDPWAWGKKFEK